MSLYKGIVSVKKTVDLMLCNLPSLNNPDCIKFLTVLYVYISNNKSWLNLPENEEFKGSMKRVLIALYDLSFKYPIYNWSRQIEDLYAMVFEDKL
jgi:hypothetical protein